MDVRLEFRALGGFTVRWSGREIPADAWVRRRAARLLKAVIGEPGARCSADLLVERLWPDSSPGAGRTNLRVKLHEIRAILASYAPPGVDVAGRPPLRFDGGVVAIDPLYGPWVDALEFERAAVSALDAEGDPHEAALQCVAVLRRWGGEYLPDEDDDATRTLRERFARLHRALYVRAADAWQRTGEEERGIQLLEEAFDVYPHDERIAGLLIAREAARARRLHARELYERHARALTERTGLTPSERLQRLAGAGGVAGAGLAARHAAPIVGRARELAAAAEAIDRAVDGSVQTLTICGDPGVGKSRLLAEVERLACARGMRVGRARCYRDPRAEDAAIDAMGCLAQLVRTIDAGPAGERANAALLEAVESGADPAALYASFRGALRALCGEHPVLLAIEDAHLTPAMAALLLNAGDGRSRAEPLLVAAALRAPVDEALRGLLGGTVLDLDALDRDACAEVAAQAFDHPPAPELAQALVDLWPGDLGVIVAAAQHAQLSGLAARVNQRWELVPGTPPAALIPEITRRMVVRRVAQLEPFADEVLKAIAYAGARADVGIVAVMVDGDVERISGAVEQLERMGLASVSNGHVDAPPAVRLICAAAVSMRRQSLFVERLADALIRASAGPR
ncbi:MAG TPA: AAA family ATPase [Candidatus Dormibacteraeota bacterium]|nr:AAA family ATPase [Candidatus Dormibacteraeota bacterium]